MNLIKRNQLASKWGIRLSTIKKISEEYNNFFGTKAEKTDKKHQNPINMFNVLA